MAQRFDEPPLREPEERFVPTVPDFFVEEVRLDAAAARFVDFVALRDFDAVLLAALLVALRLAERAGAFEPERALVERDALDFEAAFDPPRAAVDREVEAFLAVDLVEDFDADERDVDFAAVFFAPDLAEDFAAGLAEDFAAVLDVDFAAVFVPAFFAAVLFEPVFAALFDAPLAALERDEVPVDFAADLRAVEALLLAPFLAPDFDPLDERRAPLFFAVDLVLVAPVSPVNSCVSGFDLSSVGIAASFKGLRVQPSRLQGNVVIPSGFRLTESVESRTRTISVDTLAS